MKPLFRPALCVALALTPLAACGDSGGTREAQAAESARPDAAKLDVAVLRFSGIPDADKDKLTKQYEAVKAYLEIELGVPVEYVHAPDYAGAVAALCSNKLDFCWLGGVTAVQAEEQTGGKTVFVATRDEDLRFKTYFIANRALVDSGKLPAAPALEPMPLSALSALKPALAECSFTFGAKGSTSGHVMPRHFLESAEVDLDPEQDFKSPAAFQLQGGHSATLAAVASGAVDVGALNYTNWEKADDATKQNAPVIYVTPEYVDYCVVASQRLGPDLVAKLRQAFVELDPSVPAEKAVLEAFSAKRFVAADPKAWDEMRGVMKSLEERGILE